MALFSFWFYFETFESLQGRGSSLEVPRVNLYNMEGVQRNCIGLLLLWSGEGYKSIWGISPLMINSLKFDSPAFARNYGYSVKISNALFWRKIHHRIRSAMDSGGLGRVCEGSCGTTWVFIVLPLCWNCLFCHWVTVASNMQRAACHKILIEFKPCVCG